MLVGKRFLRRLSGQLLLVGRRRLGGHLSLLVRGPFIFILSGSLATLLGGLACLLGGFAARIGLQLLEVLTTIEVSGSTIDGVAMSS